MKKTFKRNFPISFKPKVVIPKFIGKMQKKSGSIMKSGVDAMPLFLLVDLLRPSIFLSYKYFLIYFYSTTQKAFGQRMRKCQHSAWKLLGFPLFFKGVRSGVQRLWSLVLSLHRGHWGRFGHIHGGWPLKTASTVQYGVEKTYTSYTTGYEWIFMIQEILFFNKILKGHHFFFILSKMKVYSYTVYFSYRSSDWNYSRTAIGKVDDFSYCHWISSQFFVVKK